MEFYRKLKDATSFQIPRQFESCHWSPFFWHVAYPSRPHLLNRIYFQLQAVIDEFQEEEMSISINRASGHILHEYRSMHIHGVPAIGAFGFNITLDGEKSKVDEDDHLYLSLFPLHLLNPNTREHIATAVPQQYSRVDVYP